MAQCQYCKTSGGNMRKCKKCSMVFCRKCASSGKGPYPKVPANKCPLCGASSGSTAV